MENNKIQISEDKEKTLNFIEQIIEEDLRNKKNEGRFNTRFPPEPNGYLHIGHAKAICFNFTLAEKYNGLCNLRLDDTNPEKEETEYVESIKEDIKWLGFNWGDRLFYASDYFDKLYEFAKKLIRDKNAYVCELSAEQMRLDRGTPKQAGVESPYRNRPVEESLDLLERMKAGEFEEGKYTLRAKIDMSSPNMNMRDPAMYRIRKAEHHRTGDKWNIYPMYDFAHGQSDAIEKITHSLCTLEFEQHRPLYDWFLDKLEFKPNSRPRQIEFARLNLSYTIMSKRKLLKLVEDKYVSGWDDPRMPTISGLRRRGYTPLSIRNFAERIGVAKRENVIDLALLEFSVREDLNKTALRRMAVLNPLKVVITNYDENKEEFVSAVNNPEDKSAGRRDVPFSRELYIEKEDFMEDAPRKFFRLAPGREVRLKYAYFVKCNEVIKDEDGNITELRCTYDPASKGGKSPDGRKVKGTLHWVSAKHAKEIEVRLYDRLFNCPSPDLVTEEGKDFISNLNPNSLEIKTAYAEPSLTEVEVEQKFQFERLGYFCVDKLSSAEKTVYNRTVALRDSWNKKK